MAHLRHADTRGRRRKAGPRNIPRRPTIAMCVGAVVGLVLGACASHPPPDPGRRDAGDFQFERDAFAFPNLVRAQRPGWNDRFANYCLVMARAAAQFHRFARFAPDRPAVSPADYDRLVRLVLARPPWDPPIAEAERIVVPGFTGLREFSAAHEGLLKAAFGSNVLSMVHWRTWRVGVDFPPEHQERLAQELLAEVGAGHTVPLMITNFPHEDILNHAVLVYGRRSSLQGVEFLAYDPNDPGSPFAIYYDDVSRGFWVGPLNYSPPGRVRAFRLYTSPLF